MKNIFFTFIGILLVLSSCNKEYYEDGGVHSGKYDGTILQFLKSRPELFDSLVKVVDLAGYTTLLSDPNADITFFAPPNVSISKSIRAVNSQLFARGQDTVLDIRQISPEVWSKYLTRYIFEGRNLLKDYRQLDTADLVTYPGQAYLTKLGREAVNIGVNFNDVKSKNNDGVEQTIKYAGYRQILIDYSNPVATSDLQPTNGVVHVLQYRKHSFGFVPYDFAAEAILKGINY